MMDASGETADDQSSGWFEVKKKHRSSSKFALQSWVGGFSKNNVSMFPRNQPLLNEKGGNSYGKNRSHLPKSGKSCVPGQGAVVCTAAMRSDSEEHGNYADKCEVKQDSEYLKSTVLSVTNSNGCMGDNSNIPQQHSLNVVSKIKWGDLEDDVLLHHENNVAPDIKFGDIGEDNLVPCRRLENACDLGLCSSSTVIQEKILLAASGSVDIHPHQMIPTGVDQVIEMKCEEANDIILDEVKEPIMNDKMIDQVVSDLDCKEVHTECSKPEPRARVEDGVEDGIVLEVTMPIVTSEFGEATIPELTARVEDSSTVVTAQDTQLIPLENSGADISEVSTVTASGGQCENPRVAAIQDNLSKDQMLGTFAEGDASESKERFRQRLWCFLFENLNRAVDELYLLCELECDVEQMKEAILVLEEAEFDFKDLTTRVEEFENVKRAGSQSIEGTPMTMKADHRRPHALSWEVRRMTTSPHRAEILSSSLEAFKKIQQERANLRLADGGKSLGLEPSSHPDISAVNLKKSVGTSNATPSVKDSAMKPKKQSGVSDFAQRNPSVEKQNVEISRSSKINIAQNGRDLTQNFSSSDVNSSRPPLKDAFSACGSGKTKREHLGSETDKLLSKKEIFLAEVLDKNLKSADHPGRQIAPVENNKEKRNTNSWKSMDAWKEKRNWQDILSSPFRVSSRISYSPGVIRKSAERARTLHDKLMSPEKKKKTALDLKKEAEEKHARALRIRSELENERVQKLQRTSEKLNRVNEWQAVRNMKLREGMHARHQRSESRHEAFIAQVVKRAGDESSKVNEVRFITSLNEENKKLMLRQKLHDSELRRAEKLQVIKSKQREDMAREEAVLERRKLIEAEKLQRLAETQRKKEEAQVRREEERKASSAAREARAIEQLRRKEERAKAQLEEAELLAQKLAERLSESEQRRKFYLEQIRERASMDFRDQTSPLVRRSSSKEGLGRSTSTNGADDYQANSIAAVEGSNLAAGNTTLQHSMKRRIKRIRQRLMSQKYEFPESPLGPENASIGYRTAVGTARVKIGRWLQELQKLRQARKEGAASIGLITAEMIKFLEGKDPELHGCRQAGLLDFIASALPASHASRPEAFQVTIHLLKLLRVVLSTPPNRSYFIAQNLLPPIIPMLSAALENYIKIAASVTVSGNASLPSTKMSVENFESVSEILDGFLWTVSAIIGHISSDARQLQMRDGLVELLVAYQVIQRLRDLFALHDRPQVEGLPFPSSILLSINLLVVLTSGTGNYSSINWESSLADTVLGDKFQEVKVVESADLGNSSTDNHCEENKPLLSIQYGCIVVPSSDLSEDGIVGALCSTNKQNESASVGEDNETKLKDSSVECNDANTSEVDVPDDSQKILVEKDEKHLVDAGTKQKNDTMLGLKPPDTFLLSAIADTGLVSLPSLLTAVLLQANNRSSSEQCVAKDQQEDEWPASAVSINVKSCKIITQSLPFYLVNLKEDKESLKASNVLPSNFEEVATGVLKVLNNLALLDITFIQRMLARPDLKMEFFHLMGFLLSYCTGKWKVASDQVGLLLLESLSLLGYFALFYPGNQAVLRWGKSPTILHKVCDLPFVFFSDPALMPVLASTLVAACYGCEQNKAVVQQELSTDMLLSLLKACRNYIPTGRSTQTLETVTADDPIECYQQGSELKKAQADVPLKSGRYNPRSTRGSSGKLGALGNSVRVSRMKNRDNKLMKTNENVAPKQNILTSETSRMLHCRFPSSFIDRAEQFFSKGLGEQQCG